MLHLLIKPFQDNDEEGSADSDDACTIMPPAAVCEPLRFDLASVCTAPKSKQVSTYKAPFKKNVGDDDIAGSPEKSQKKRRNEIPSFGKQLGNTLRRSKQKKSIFSTFSGNKEASASASASLPSLSQASASAEPLPSHLASQATWQTTWQATCQATWQAPCQATCQATWHQHTSTSFYIFLKADAG